MYGAKPFGWIFVGIMVRKHEFAAFFLFVLKSNDDFSKKNLSDLYF